MKIAVASNNEGTVAQHFGHCHTFLVFKIEKEKIISREKRGGKDIKHDHQHDSEHSGEDHHKAQMDLIADCQAVICKGMGHRAAEALEKNGIQPVVMTGEASAEEAARLLVQNLLQQSKPHKCCCQHKHHH